MAERAGKLRYDKDTVLDTAMQVIKDEHAAFVAGETDNCEHIPRILRVAESAGTLLNVDGMGKQEVRANVDRIVEFGRRLFVQEWMRPISGETERPREEDALREFDRYLRPEKGVRRRRGSRMVGTS